MSVGSSVGRLDDSAGLGLVAVGLGISGRAGDLVETGVWVRSADNGVGRDTVGVGNWMDPPPVHDVSTATATARPAIFMSSGGLTMPPGPAALHTPAPRRNVCLKLDTLRRVTGVTS